MTEPVFSSVTELEKKGHEKFIQPCTMLRKVVTRWITLNSPFSVQRGGRVTWLWRWGGSDIILATLIYFSGWTL